MVEYRPSDQMRAARIRSGRRGRRLPAETVADAVAHHGRQREIDGEHRKRTTDHEKINGEHWEMENDIANSPRDTSTAEKKQGGRCAWLARADGDASSLEQRRLDEGGCGRSRAE